MPRAPLALALLVACSPSVPGGASDSADASTSTSSSTSATSTSTSTSSSTSSSSTTATPTTGEPTSVSTSTGDATTDAGSTTGEPATLLRYDEVRQKSSHNSYQRHESLIDQLLVHRVRSLELDIHRSAAFAPALVGDWYVYHIDVIDADSQCRHLSQCLGQLAAFQRASPLHEVLTLWIDLKDDFAGDHTPAHLDALLLAAFGERLLTPAELRAACPAATTLQAAVTAPGCDWPALTDLRGRVLVALTGGDLDVYTGADPDARAAFVAPALTSADDIVPHASLFHNLELGDVDLAAAVRDAGLVARVWVADDEGAWSQSGRAGVHHIATNKINAGVDPWATTAGPEGWPFRCLGDCDPPARESGARLAVTVDSGDLWGDSDDALFLHYEPAGDLAISALVGVPSSHTEPWGKACLSARLGLDAGAASLSICRPADDHPPRVQLRASPGGDTEAFELPAPAGLGAELPAFLRLERAGACARGLASADGLAWTLVAEHCFPEPPTHLGVAASSHGAGALRVDFADLRADPGGPLAAGDLALSALGGALGAAVDAGAP